MRRSSNFENRIDKFKDIIDKSTCVFLGGAGVSTESGIPDFRSNNGLYNKPDKRYLGYRPEYLLSIDCLFDNPKVFFDYYKNQMDVRKVEPNIAHKKLAQLESEGKLAGIITQNIDGLHQKAGSVNVNEIHGTIWKNHCVSCGAEYDVNYIFDSKDEIPMCEKCGKMVRPNVVLYGEDLPEIAYKNSIALMNKADTLIIGGTSLCVSSATNLLKHFAGKYLIIINKTPLDIEYRADLVFQSMGEVFGAI